MIKNYRKKPVVIEAVCFDKNFNKIAEWCGGKLLYDRNKVHEIAIQTLEGMIRGSIGDYIIKGVKGEFYPCKPDIFRETYEEACDE